MSTGTDWVNTIVGAYASIKGVNVNSNSLAAVPVVIAPPARVGVSPTVMWVGAGMVGLLALALIKR
jgi:hypothetical protein